MKGITVGLTVPLPPEVSKALKDMDTNMQTMSELLRQVLLALQSIDTKLDTSAYRGVA